MTDSERDLKLVVMGDVDRSTFGREVAAGLPGLARAALLFAREIGYRDLLPSRYIAQIDEWAVTLQNRGAAGMPVESTVDAIRTLLFEEVGLHGNRDDYYDPRNSFLNEVMDRGTGLPITLSILFLELANRLGVSADGIGLPGHFLVAVHVREERRLLDPFSGGREVSLEEAVGLVYLTSGYEGPLRPEWLRPMSPELIMARMLFNLRAVCLNRESWRDAASVMRCLSVLQPTVVEHCRDLGLLQLRNRAFVEAASCLEEYLSRAPDAPDKRFVENALTSALSEHQRLN